MSGRRILEPRIGVKKALAFQEAPSIAIAMDVITGVVGGIIRDLLARESLPRVPTGALPVRNRGAFRRTFY